MAQRVVYGNSVSENGWPIVDQDSCEWITVPGTGVSLQLQQGQPSQLLRAWAADWNAYLEPLRDNDSAGWTATNSVPTSNHLGGTAIDLNWDSHPFRKRGSFNAAQMQTLSQMEDFYEGCVFWAGRWNEPVDEMHSQMGYNTYGDPHTAEFIKRNIRADGYSTFRRGEQQLSKADEYALAIIAEGQRRNVTPRGIQIALATALVESGLRMYANASVPESMSIPHDAVGSDHDSVGLFQQRCPMWGPAHVLMDPVKSAGLFYDHLVALDYNNTANSPGSYAQAVQRSAYPDRYDQRFDDAVTVYNRLVTTAPTTGEGFLMALSDAEQRELLDLARQQSSYRRVSRSPLRHVGEGPTETATGFDLNVDGNVHVLLVQKLAQLGDPDALALLNEVANLDPARYPDRAHDKQLAQAILNDVAQQSTTGSAPPSGVTPGVIAAPVIVATPVQPTYAPTMPVTVSTAPTTPLTTGGLLGDLADLASTVRRANDAVKHITEGDQ